jgi:iron complex transport system ATP-binding protein
MKPFFEANHLAYRYPQGPLAVRDISLAVEPASTTAIVGANGSGKSTLIRMLAGLLRPVSGRILLDGLALEEWQPRVRAREIAYMPQNTAAAFPFRALDVVLSGRTPHVARWSLENAHDGDRAMEALESVGQQALVQTAE